jgi:hypothetical protein
MTTDQDRALMLSALESWREAIQSADAKIRPVVDALKLPPESPVIEAVSNLQYALTFVVSAVLEDEKNWLIWYWRDNRMGAGGAVACPPGQDLRPIKTLDDLLWLLGYGETPAVLAEPEPNNG